MFNLINFTPGRGAFNNFSTPSGAAIHTYYSDDAIGTILTTGYFPAYFNLGSDFIKPFDTLVINTSTKQSYICTISSVTPSVTLLAMQAVQHFPTLTATGAYSGQLNVMLTKNLLTKIVSFEFLKLQQISVGNGTIQLFQATGVPDPFKPDASVGQIMKTMVGYNVGSGTVFNGYCLIQSSNIFIGPYTSVTPGGGQFGGGTVQLPNFSVNYLGT